MPASYTSTKRFAHGTQKQEEDAEKASLWRLLRSRCREYPNTPSPSMLHWYLERVKESRMRYTDGSAGSRKSLAVLIRYAARRRDVSTLMRLRALARVSEQEESGASALVVGSSRDAQDSLLHVIDNALFWMAAKQRDWKMMHLLAHSRRGAAWTPSMCRAFLRAVATQSKQNDRLDDAGLSQYADSMARYWSGLQSHFDQYLRGVRRGSSTEEAGHIPELKNTPQWLIISMLEMHASAGLAAEAAQLVDAYLNSLKDTTSTKQHTAIKGAADILTNDVHARKSACNATIPSAMLLNQLLTAYLRAGLANEALRVFSCYTTAEALPQDEEVQVRKEPPILLEPDSTSVLLALDALEMLSDDDMVRARSFLDFLMRADRDIGTFRRKDERRLTDRPHYAISLRVMARLLRLLPRVQDQGLQRRVIRFQEGLLRRQLRIAAGPERLSLRDARDSRPNPFFVLARWHLALRQVPSIADAHRASLYGMARELVRFVQPSRGEKAERAFGSTKFLGRAHKEAVATSRTSPSP